MSLKANLAKAGAIALLLTGMSAPVLAQVPPPVFGSVRFASQCDAHFVVLIGGDPTHYVRFALASGMVVHMKLPQGSTYAMACDQWPDVSAQFTYVQFDQ